MSGYFLGETFAREWNRIRNKIDGMRGAGVTNTPNDIIINPSTARTENGFGGNRWRLVKISAPTAGGGKYTGRVLDPPAADISNSGTLAAADLGADPGADNALILNVAELGFNTHYLETGRIYPGIITRINADGTYVVAIFGLMFEDCEGG